MARSPDGMFRLKQPSSPLPFSGERLTTDFGGQVELEHLHRYCFARDFCVDRDVLDIASGEGYGSSMLATVARQVVGVELAVEANLHAQREYSASNLSFISGDATAIPLDDASFDVVVSFETLEHLRDHDRFLAEVRRVLRPGGILIVSTPDRLVHSGIGMGVNPFHIRELSRPEFETALAAHFKNMRVLPQRTFIGSAILEGHAGVRTYEKRDATTIEATTGLARAVYLIGVASDAELPALPDSVFAHEQSVDAIFRQLSDARQVGDDAKAALAANDLALEKAKRDLAEQRAHERRSQAGLAEERRTRARQDHELQALRASLQQMTERANALQVQHGEAEALRAIAADAVAQKEAIVHSTSWRATYPLRRIATQLPAPARQRLKRAVKALYRPNSLLQAKPETAASVAAPIELLAEPGIAPALSPAAELASSLPSVSSLLAARFPSLQPFDCFPAATAQKRISLVTDSVGPSSLFGGVGTAIILGALLANKFQATLRIVTRTEEPDASAVNEVLRRNNVSLHGPLETAMAPLDGSKVLPVSADEIFLTTSWWTTKATLGVVPASRIIALIQEDERLFYARGDEQLLCAETMGHPALLTVINTERLFQHLTSGAEPFENLKENGLWFEPAFPGGAKARKSTVKRRLFFYARPNNLRNLFWRGIEALDEAVAVGAFAPDRWEIHLIGRDIPKFKLARGVVPQVVSHLSWGDYQEFIASLSAGFVLMDTPHPSYPPLDMAIAGVPVLTNTHPGKYDLLNYSGNILTVSPSVEGLVAGLQRLEALAEDEAAIQENRKADHINRDWTLALEAVVSRIDQKLNRAN